MERRMDQWDLVIMVKHGDTPSGIGAHVHGQLMDLNMSKLRSKIISLFKISHDAELIMSYTDEDGGIATLDDDDELRDAVIGQHLNPLRINVQLESTDSSDARPERSSPSSSVNAPRPVVIPTVVEQENTILEDIELPSGMTRVNQIPNEDNRPGNVVVQGAGVMTHSVDRNVEGAVAKNGKSSLYPIDDIMASICTAKIFAEHEHEEGGCMAQETIPINMDGSAGIMDGGCSSKQPSMKADLSSPSQTGFNSQAKVPISGPSGASTEADHLKLFSRTSEGTTYAGRRPLDVMGVHSGVQCDKCGMRPIVGPRFKSNVKEGCDLCTICFTQMGNEADHTRIEHAHRRDLMRLKALRSRHARIRHPPPSALHGCVVTPQRASLDSRFIQDVTVLDGTVMLPSTHFTKIWRLRNNGNVPWPVGTQLVWVGGDQFGDRVTAHLEIPQVGVPFDEDLDIAVDLTAPSRPGCYGSVWRMASPYMKKFGHRVWVLIQVDYSPPNSAAGSGFHPCLNPNLPPESNGRDVSVTIDEEWVERAVEDVSGGHVERPAQVAGGLMAAASYYPLIDPSDASPPIAVTAGDGNHVVEQTLLKELEEMGFKQIERNKGVIRLNGYDLEQSVDDLRGYAEWDPLLSELKEKGFNDKELNKKLLIKKARRMMLLPGRGIPYPGRRRS